MKVELNKNESLLNVLFKDPRINSDLMPVANAKNYLLKVQKSKNFSCLIKMKINLVIPHFSFN